MANLSYQAFGRVVLGTEYVGYKIGIFEPGTTTAKTTYKDSGLTTGNENTHPVVLDANGAAQIWFANNAKSILYDPDDTVVYTDDNVNVVLFTKGTDIASANDLILPNDGNYNDITGTTTINGMTTPTSAIRYRKLHFDDALTLKHNTAPSTGYSKFWLPAAADFTTAANDELEFIWDGTYWRMTAQVPRGTPVYANTITTAGDLLYGTGASAITRLGIGTATQILQVNAGATAPQWISRTQEVVQVVNVTDGAVATGTTAIPIDDTIPQNTEGDQYMSLAITPTSASNILVIEIVFHGSNTATGRIVAALFQDATANALAVSQTQGDETTTTAIKNIAFRHYMAAGTTNSTTFKVRGGSSSGTTTFNGESGSRIYGGVISSSITITEYLP